MIVTIPGTTGVSVRPASSGTAASSAGPYALTLTPVLPKGPSVNFGMVGDATFEPVSAGSSGGWQIVDRPRQKAITQWYDASPMSLVLDLLLDGGGTSVEPDAARLFAWQYPPAGGIQPPVLSVKGPIDAQAKALYWIVYTLKFDQDNVIRNDSGDRTQQSIHVTLYEYCSATAAVLTNLSPAKVAQKALTSSHVSTTSRRTYVVKSGDTLSGIAARVLGNVALWPTIASANNIRDPNNIQVGQVLIMPSS